MPCGYFEQFAIHSKTPVNIVDWFCDANFPTFKIIRPGQFLRYKLRIKPETDATIIDSTTITFHATETAAKSFKIQSQLILRTAPFVFKLLKPDSTESTPYCWPITLDKDSISPKTRQTKQLITKKNGLINFKIAS